MRDEELRKLIIEALQDGPMLVDRDGYYSCWFCDGNGAWKENEVEHDHDCVWVRIEAELARPDGGRWWDPELGADPGELPALHQVIVPGRSRGTIHLTTEEIDPTRYDRVAVLTRCGRRLGVLPIGAKVEGDRMCQQCTLLDVAVSE